MATPQNKQDPKNQSSTTNKTGASSEQKFSRNPEQSDRSGNMRNEPMSDRKSSGY